MAKTTKFRGFLDHYVYFAYDPLTSLVKIGYTSNLKKRMQQLKNLPTYKT